MKISFNLNKTAVQIDAPANERLLSVLRREFNLLSLKSSCLSGQCGSCTVLMNDKPVPACFIPVFNVEGKNIITLEYFKTTEEYKIIATGFDQAGVEMCGFCDAGKIFFTYAILNSNIDIEAPDAEEIVRKYYSSTMCRCTSFEDLFSAIQKNRQKSTEKIALMTELTKNSIVYRVHHMQEMQTILKNISNIKPIAGATGFLNHQTDEILDLPEHILDLNFLPELKVISKTERYFEFGAAVTLNEILDLGKKNIPPALYYSIEKIANNAIRSLATIGGNIATANPLAGTFLPMLALDAKLEIRTAEDIEWVPFARYIDKSYAEKRQEKYIISRIRIPNETWTKSFYTRLGTPGYTGSDTASFLFLILIQKNILSDMRLFFASDKLIRNKEFDNLLLGKDLPLSQSEVPVIIQKAKQIFTPEQFSSEFHHSCFYNLLEDNLYKLT